MQKGEPLALLVGMQTDTATLENSVEVPQEVKTRATLRCISCTTGYLPKDTDVVKRWDTCTPVFIAAMSTMVTFWKEPQCPSTDEWRKKTWSIYTMEYYSAIRKDEYPPFALMWLKLEGIMLSEVSQLEKENHHMVSLIWGI